MVCRLAVRLPVPRGQAADCSGDSISWALLQPRSGDTTNNIKVRSRSLPDQALRSALMIMLGDGTLGRCRAVGGAIQCETD